MADPYIKGFWFPEGGMESHPFGGQTVEGVQAWPEPDGTLRWYVQVGTLAWDRWQLRGGVDPVGPRAPKVVGLGRENNVLVGPWHSAPSISVQSGSVETGEGDPVIKPPEFANDPDLGIVPVGTPTDQSMAARIWNAPARLVARLLPAGEVSSTVATAVNLTPWLLWLLVAWWIWRKVRR